MWVEWQESEFFDPFAADWLRRGALDHSSALSHFLPLEFWKILGIRKALYIELLNPSFYKGVTEDQRG